MGIITVRRIHDAKYANSLACICSDCAVCSWQRSIHTPIRAQASFTGLWIIYCACCWHCRQILEYNLLTIKYELEQAMQHMSLIWKNCKTKGKAVSVFSADPVCSHICGFQRQGSCWTNLIRSERRGKLAFDKDITTPTDNPNVFRGFNINRSCWRTEFKMFEWRRSYMLCLQCTS